MSARKSFKNFLTTRPLLLAAAGALITVAPSWAQFNLGTITGTVHDPNGGAVASCKVTAVNLADSNARIVQTNGQGIYTIASILAGTYEIAAECPGFQKSTAKLTVGVDRTINFDFDVALGNVTSQIEVTAEPDAIALQRDTHEISQLVTTKQLDELPSSGRNFLNLATLGTGAQPAKDSFVTSGGPVSNFGSVGREVILGGQFVGSTTFLQDAVINVNLLTQTANIVASMDSIQEASVESNGMSAKFASPGVVNVITKRGTNAFHGTAYDYLQNDALNARSFFASSVPVLRYNQSAQTSVAQS